MNFNKKCYVRKFIPVRAFLSLIYPTFVKLLFIKALAVMEITMAMAVEDN